MPMMQSTEAGLKFPKWSTASPAPQDDSSNAKRNALPATVFHRRQFFGKAAASLLLGTAVLAGCRGTSARIMNPWDQEAIGSDKAGSEIYNPIVAATTDKLLARAGEFPADPMMRLDASGFPPRRRVCFVGLENLSAEELGDFKEHITATINQRIVESEQFEVLHRNAVGVGLGKIGARPDELFLPATRRRFAQIMEQDGTPVDLLMFAKITTGTTQAKKDMQREYKLTLELVDVKSAQAAVTESCTMRKEYNKSVAGKTKAWFK